MVEGRRYGRRRGGKCRVCSVSGRGEAATGRRAIHGRDGSRQGRVVGGRAAAGQVWRSRISKVQVRGELHCAERSEEAQLRVQVGQAVQVPVLHAPQAAPARPTTLHVKGCSASRTAPPYSPLPDEFREEIRERTGVQYSRSHLHILMTIVGLSAKTSRRYTPTTPRGGTYCAG